MTKAQVEHELELMVEARDLYGQIIPGEKCICAAIDFRNWPDNLQMACGYCREITLIMAALAARERAVWEEVAQWCDQEVQRWNPAPENAVALTRQQARAQEAAEIAAWCRHQAEGVKP